MPPEAMLRGAAAGVSVIGDAAELEALEPAWWSLWRRAPGATPFQSPAWLLPWWRRFGEGPLRAAALRREDGLAALMPAYIHEEPDGARKLLLVGVGTSDYLDALVAPDEDDDAPALLLAALLDDTAGEWDVAELHPLRHGSPLRGCRLPQGLGDERSQCDTCVVLELPGDGDPLARAVPKRMRDKLRYYRRRLAKHGTVEVREATSPDEALALYAHVERLHAARWEERGEEGVLAGSPVRAFHHDAVRALAAAALLRMHAVAVDGEVIAAYYGLAAHGRHYYYISGFDPAWDRCSPGTVVVGHALERAAAEGARAFDFLRGQERYKYAWGATDRPLHLRRIRAARGGRGA